MIGASGTTRSATGRGNAHMVEVREAEPPPPTLVELSTLPRIDYADAFFMPLPTAETRGAGEWVRLIFSETSPLWRSALPRAGSDLAFDWVHRMIRSGSWAGRSSTAVPISCCWRGDRDLGCRPSW